MIKLRQSLFPVWFRAYLYIPALGLLYFVIPLHIWNFSPHALTHTLPRFLLGGTDWGTGNIYTFTKIACWISLVLGVLANNALRLPDGSERLTFLQRLRLHTWHFAAVVIISLMAVLAAYEFNNNWQADVVDTLLLLAYFVVSAGFIIWLLTRLQHKPRDYRGLLPLLLAIAWGFVTVSLSKP